MITENIDNTKEKIVPGEHSEMVAKEMVVDNSENTPTDATHMPEPPATSTTKISLRDVILAEIQEKIKVSKELQQKINDSKTKPKRELYIKKIRKNNEQVAELLLALKKIDNNKKIQNETKQTTNENSDKLA